MRLSYVLGAVVAMGVSAFLVIQILGSGRAKMEVNKMRPDQNVAAVKLASKDGPQPKVVVETEFDFGRMELGEVRSHEFTFRNDGQGPLIIKMEKTTCQCTVADMKELETREVAPGKSTDIKLTWKPEFMAEKFNKGADFRTNDPEHEKVSLRVVGMVAPRMAIHPETHWVLSNLTDDKPGVFAGTIMSPVSDNFKVTSVESPSNLLSFEVTQLTPQKMEIHNGLCGYEIKVTVKPEMPLGAFLFPVTIKTDLPELAVDGREPKNMEFEVLVSGIRRGPIRLGGREWIDDKMGISLGQFEATKGKKVRMPIFVSKLPEEGLKLTAAPVCDPPELKVHIDSEEKGDGKPPRYFLNIEYPAGSPRIKHYDDKPGKIRLQTNHSHGQEVEFLVLFSAY